MIEWPPTYKQLLFFLPPFLSSMFGKQLLLFLHIFLSMFVKQLLLFFAKSPLSSPLLCFVDDEIVQVHTLYGIWADDQELMRNLTSLAAAPTLPSPFFSVMMPWCSKFMIKWWLTCFWGLFFCCLPLLLWIWKILLFNPLTLSNMLSYHHNPLIVVHDMFLSFFTKAL